ncbi:MAG: aspartate aminotransferase family protein, partial [Evtepia sp.]
IMMELIQGEGGVNPLDKELVQKVAQLCQEKDWLLLIDEVQTGVGRTGSLFAFQQYGIQPDVSTFAKGIAGGLPMGGILANETCAKVLTAGTHGSTFGANPIAAAAACTILDILDDQMMEEVKAKGQYLREGILALNSPYLGDVVGMGLMLGVDVKGERTNKELASLLAENGLLVLTAGPRLRLLPPLTITKEEMDKGLAILKQTLA